MSATENKSNSHLLEGYATTAVPQSISVSGLRIGFVNGALAFAVPGLITGLEVGGALGFTRSLLAFFVGGLILAVLGTVTGIVGRRNRLTACLTISCVFGGQGATVINLLIALSLLGWYGVNMDLFSAVIGELVLRWQGVHADAFLIEVLAGIVVTAITLFGFTLMERLSTGLVPLMVLVVLYLASNLGEFSIHSPMIASAPALSLGEAISVVVGSFIVGVVLMPDFTRFAGTDKDAATASFFAFLLLSSFVYVISAAAGLMVQSIDVLEVLLALGVGSVAFLLIVVSAFLTNVVNLYSAGLGVNAVFVNLKQWHIIIALGVLGTALASLNLLDHFTQFLFSLAVIFAPIAGVYIVDYFYTRRQAAYTWPISPVNRSRQWIALFAWLLGISVSLMSQAGYIRLLHMDAIDGMLAAMLFYGLLSRRFPDTSESL